MKKQRPKSLVKTMMLTVKNRLEDKCLWCGRSKKDGKWHTADGVVAAWIERVYQYVLNAYGHGKCLSKLKINFCSKTHCVFCNMSFSPEKNVPTVDSDKFPLINRWMA